MKKIEAIIRRDLYEQVKDALNAVGVQFFSFWDVRGCGKAHDKKQYRGTEYDTSFIERRFLSIVVNEAFVDITVKTILESACTGEIGDGKIFISPIEETIRIRNGERGPEAIYLKEKE
ncbi:MAG: P-II family nitrogen regulator [Bacteroidales bacterium]|nr:P-II family nitrogen regulator [Bacteroidales bacterium]